MRINRDPDAYLISEAKRYDVRGRKYIGTPKKYYFEDMGLRNARLNFRQTEQTHIMENVIYNELRTRDFNVDVGVVKIRRSSAMNNWSGISLRKKYADSLPFHYSRKKAVLTNGGTAPLHKISDGYQGIRIIDAAEWLQAEYRMHLRRSKSSERIISDEGILYPG